MDITKIKKYAKGVVAVAGAVAVVANAVANGDLNDAGDWYEVIVAALVAAGVIAIPNKRA